MSRNPNASPSSGGEKLSETIKAAMAIEAEHKAKVDAQAPEMFSRLAAISVAKRRGEPVPEFPPLPVTGQSRAIAAAAIGLGESTYARAKMVMQNIAADPEGRKSVLDVLDTLGITPAHNELKRLNGGSSRHRALSRLSRRNRSKEVERAVHSLSGIVYVLKDIQASDLPPERISDLAREITRSTSEINRFVRRIKNG